MKFTGIATQYTGNGTHLSGTFIPKKTFSKHMCNKKFTPCAPAIPTSFDHVGEL